MRQKKCITIFEYDALISDERDRPCPEGLQAIPPHVYDWLEHQCYLFNDEDKRWLTTKFIRGRRAIQVRNYVGAIQSPDGFQIEILPKIGKALSDSIADARLLLIEMLRCLPGFEHFRKDNARLAVARMPLLEIFIAEFLAVVGRLVKRGLRGDYRTRRENLHVWRGKLLISAHLRQNMIRADRVFTEHDDFTTDRPENRILHSALRRVLNLSRVQANLRLGRELAFAFAEVPLSEVPAQDFQRVRLDRNMGHYQEAITWARMILEGMSPLSVDGSRLAPSLLFPMEKLFEAFVGKHLRGQLRNDRRLHDQARGQYLTLHREKQWCAMRPDWLVRVRGEDVLVLDAKWKLLNEQDSGSDEKYGLNQADLYQLYAYGQHYLNGKGDVILIYPKTEIFSAPLPAFYFPKADGLRLWVLPFCLKTKRLLLPQIPDQPEAVLTAHLI